MKLSSLSLFISSLLLAGCTEKGTSAQTLVLNDEQSVLTAVLSKPIIVKMADAQLMLTEEERFIHFVDGLKAQALMHGISQPIVNAAFTDVTLMKRAIVADKNQLEKKVTLDDYLRRVLPNSRIKEAKERHQQYLPQLNKAAKKYGVSSNYIVALWGMESSFGRMQGKDNIISAMSTLAFEGRRQAFFSKQVMAALEILQQGHVSIDRLKGSWAGAMGQCQFMPTSFLTYGADGDGDGRIDIWSNVDDVFASTANYLSTEGWQVNQRWGREITLPAGFDAAFIGLDDHKSKTVAQWQKLGIKVASANKVEQQQRAWIILPDDGQGRAFIVYDNFRTIMHWNRSIYFALSIGLLADSIEQR